MINEYFNDHNYNFNIMSIIIIVHCSVNLLSRPSDVLFISGHSSRNDISVNVLSVD